MSLTPNEDRARAAVTPADALESEQLPGIPGAVYRIQNALLRAYAVALAREIDLDTDNETVARAVTIAIGAMVASLATSLSDQHHVASMNLLRAICAKTGRSVADFDRNGASSEFEAVEAGHA